MSRPDVPLIETHRFCVRGGNDHFYGHVAVSSEGPPMTLRWAKLAYRHAGRCTAPTPWTVVLVEVGSTSTPPVGQHCLVCRLRNRLKLKTVCYPCPEREIGTVSVLNLVQLQLHWQMLPDMPHETQRTREWLTAADMDLLTRPVRETILKQSLKC